MSNVSVNKAAEQDKAALPVFQEVERRMEEVRRRAYELFLGRGGELGRDTEDWLAAERDVLGEASIRLEEKPEQFEIEAGLDGFEAPQVEVTVTPGEVAIHAVRKDQNSSREVLRRFELPRPIRMDQVTARLENGTLRITAPCESKDMSVGGPRRTVAVA